MKWRGFWHFLVATGAAWAFVAGCGQPPPEEAPRPQAAAGLSGPLTPADDDPRITEGLEARKALIEQAYRAEGEEVPAEVLVQRLEQHRQWLRVRYTEYPTAQGHLQEGARLQDAGEFELAAVHYAAATAKEPEMAAAYAGMGYCQLRLRLVDEALASMEKALTLRPDTPVWLVELGECYYAKQDYDGALRQYRRAAELRPEYAGAYAKIATAWLFKGDYDKA